jgi:hypothetical protein
MSEVARLAAWYYRQCNGEWEHQYGVDIGTLDNPGWTLTVDLAETTLETVPYSPIREGLGPDAHPAASGWISCKLVDRQWKGAGDESKLERLIREFVTWAEQNDS